MINQNLALILLSTFALSACAKSANEPQTPSTNQQSTSPELQSKIQKLVEKTKKNMIFVEGGTFMMGDFDHYDSKIDSKPVHKVILDSFSMSAYKATYADLDIYSAATNTPKVGSTESHSSQFRYPVSSAGVSWQEGRNYCQWLGKQLKLNMDLPTEAQWEYAARNRGQKIHFPTNSGKIEDGVNVWDFDQRKKLSREFKSIGTSISVNGRYPPSKLGFYDLITDNYEWMLDWYAADYYQNSPEKNPQGPKTGTEKVLRSAKPLDGQSLQMGEGLTVRRSHAHPIQPVDFPERFKGVINPNFDNSVRCVVNQTKKIM
ncbi:formylglycine-generating enzyme family protein [Acinetobacter gandensis]|uniref:formylglycine-generating enzyme family protein n=1 Tax=Acinetobacter gandensis TaxID=1443941 RepID=UPI003989DEFE